VSSVGPPSAEGLPLLSGLPIKRPLERVLGFCAEEYEYYDAVPRGDPNRVEPVDVLATVGINSRIDTATKVRTVHRGIGAACDPLLPSLPPDADLLQVASIDGAVGLVEAAMTSKYVLLASATKVLHRKRPRLIPVLDSVVVRHYLNRLDEGDLLYRSWSDRRAAAAAARLAMEEFRRDLQHAVPWLEPVQEAVAGAGYILSQVRLLDILIWTELEESGYYR
jgi:hypothetical protein